MLGRCKISCFYPSKSFICKGFKAAGRQGRCFFEFLLYIIISLVLSIFFLLFLFFSRKKIEKRLPRLPAARKALILKAFSGRCNFFLHLPSIYLIYPALRLSWSRRERRRARRQKPPYAVSTVRISQKPPASANSTFASRLSVMPLK